MNAVARIEEAPQTGMVAASEGATILAVIGRAAADPNTDTAKMRELLSMHRELKMQQAESDFNIAMSRVQSNMGRIGTDRTNNQTHSDYATYGKLDRVLRPIYTREGFALSFGTDPIEVEAMVRVTCHVSHTGGYTRKYSIDMPSDGKGAKGNDVMTRTHATGSATQYGMRYLLKMIFNVAIGAEDEDDDGNGAGNKGDHGDGAGKEVPICMGPAFADWREKTDGCVTPEDFQAVWSEMAPTVRAVMKDYVQQRKLEKVPA